MYIKIRAITEAREEKVEEQATDHYTVWVREPAEQNRANARILELFRNKFPHTRIRIVSGHHAPSKIISVEAGDEI